MTNGDKLTTFFLATALIFVLIPDMVQARPEGRITRHKRVSDQRLAELETLLALANMKGRLVTVPVGFGRVDPAKIGRKRRSTESIILQKLRPVQSNFDSEEFENEIPIQSWLQMEDEKEDERQILN